ncbi:MAG TPA: DUF222 domain-containing protein [Streptosporangiaceae bacterium]
MRTIPSPENMAEAMQGLRAIMGYLAAANLTEMVADEQAELLQVLEQAHAMETAARARGLGAFTAAQSYHQDACYGARSWLTTKLGITKAAATAYLSWARRADAHPRVIAALAAVEITESVAGTICAWTGKLPQDCQDSADAILVAAALSGASLADLARLAAEIYARSRPPDPDDDPDGFSDRSVHLETTFEGAGVLGGDLTPECAAVVGAVLDALSAPAGAGDLRTHGQRYHDALQDAMQRLLAAGLLPARAGQPVRAWMHMSLVELLALDGDGMLQGQWIEAARVRWAGHRAAASVAGSDGAAWLDGAAAAAVACDALVSPVVTGDVDPSALDGLIRLCVELARWDNPDLGDPDLGDPDLGEADPDDADREPSATSVARGFLSREALERAIIGQAVALLSGPGGLASFLRRQQLGAPLAGLSLPLDIGYSDTVPAAIRHAVTLRDQHCRWAGGCTQPAVACQVHHVRHKANGGPTSVKDCILLCFFHHQVAIHRWGWTLVLNADGTTTAWNPDRTKVLHSHGPPARAG